MGLGVTLSNALSGMKTTQDGLTVLSRNVANAGSAGYHRQGVVIKDMNGGSSNYATFVGIDRAFTASLERAQVREVSGTGYADVRDTFLQRLEIALGKPGDANSLDTLLSKFSNSMQALAVSPEDYATRATTVSSAQDLAHALNGLSNTIQELRRETETQIGAGVDTLNQSLKSLQAINNRLSDYTLDDSARLSVLDERDRLVKQVSDIVDTQVVYRPDDTVALMTTSGLGLLDQGATTFTFEPSGSLSATSLYNIDDSKNSVGVLTAVTPSGLKLDVIDQRLVQSGRLAGLVNLRDTTLVQAQAQLDSIASSLATAFNTTTTQGTAVTGGPTEGFDVDTSTMLSGNDLSFSYVQGGQTYSVKVVRVDDSDQLPLDYKTTSGERVIGVSFAAGAGPAASELNTLLGPGISFAASGSTLQIRDDGGVNSTIKSATTHTTATTTQGQLAVGLFTDLGDKPFSNSLDGGPQARGFASRISVNSAIANDNSLLVQYQNGGSLGDGARIDYMLDRLENTDFTPDSHTLPELGSYSISGTVQGLVQQVINYQGDQIAGAKTALDTQNIALDAVQQRIDAEYGVNVDDEMARLMELQNSYAASARVVSVAQKLIDSLMQI